MKRFFILYCFAALVLSSCGGDAVVINEGTLYRIITDKDEGFGRFTRTSGSYWRGTYYRETEGALNASARDVVFRNGRRPSMESADGEKFRVESIAEYEPPRYKEYPFASDYRDSVFSVTELHDITYAKAYGYWSSFPDNGRSNLAIFMSRVPDLSKSDLDLTMDVYLPEDGGKVLRPLLILIHGGAFFNGDKASLGFPEWGRHFAAAGYVVASVNYRLGFHLNTISVERAGFRAVQDVNSAIAFILHDRERFRADPERVFLAGTSAGGIAALNAAFMRDANIPKSSKGEGGIMGVNEGIAKPFKVRAVGNMWGAVEDTTIFGNARTPVLSIHSTGDPIVPFGEGHPFTKIFGNDVIFPKMFGSAAVTRLTRSRGSVLMPYDLPGRHTLHIDEHEDGSKLLNSHFREIEAALKDFFSANMFAHPAKIERLQSSNIFKIDMTDVKTVSWKVEGGVILERNGGRAEVLMFPDAPSRSLTASGEYHSGIAFMDTMDL